MLGLGGVILWVSLLKYYDRSKGYNIVLNTIYNSSGIIIKALIGTLPIFIGFAILGMCIFWRSKRFDGLSSSLFSLFALMNGDAIFDVGNDLRTINFALAQLYLYFFISFSILVILNVFIIIIEDGYIISKYRPTNYWAKPTKQPDNGKLNSSMILFRHILWSEGTC